MPVISIIVPVYNVEKYIYRCIDSILAQTFTDFECILIDDGSTDNSSVICDDYVIKDNRIVVIHQDNRGSSAARNIGLDIAKGKYVGFVDSDDWIEPDMFEKLYVKAISEDFDIVWCDYYEDYQENSKKKINKVDGLDKNEIIKKILNGYLKGSVWNKIVKKDIITNNNIYFPNANFMEDVAFTIQIVYHSKKIGYINNALYHYVFNSFSITKNFNRIKLRDEESFDNLNFILSFLKEKYKNDIFILEPELSHRINWYKKNMLRTKESRDIKKLFSLYPESHKYIFDKREICHPLSRIFLYLATKKIIFPYKIFDVLFPVNIRLLKQLKKLKG